MTRELSAQHLHNWNELQTLAEKMVPVLGSLYRNSSVVIRVFGLKIANASIISIINAHLHGATIVDAVALRRNGAAALSTRPRQAVSRVFESRPRN